MVLLYRQRLCGVCASCAPHGAAFLMTNVTEFDNPGPDLDIKVKQHFLTICLNWKRIFNLTQAPGRALGILGTFRF